MAEKMTITEEIHQRMRLPEPTKTSDFEAVDVSREDSSRSSPQSSISSSSREYKRISRNVNLYEQDTHNVTPLVNCAINENEINAVIREINSGSCSDKAIQKQFEKRQIIAKQKKPDPLAVSGTEKELKNENLEKDKKLFKHNALMRGLVERQFAELDITRNDKANSSSGKNKESITNINGGMLVQSIDDPDFYYLRDTTTAKSDVIDDGFRFEHRGTKTTVRPRQHALYGIDESEFTFKK